MFISCLHYIYTIFILYVQHVHMLLICFYTILYVKYLCVLSIFCDIVILNDFDIFQIWVNWTALLFLNIQYIICLVSWYPMISKDNPPANARCKRRKGDLFVQMFGLIPVKIWQRERIQTVGGLEHEFYDFPFSWECHHPNWRTPSFFRGVGIPPTS